MNCIIIDDDPFYVEILLNYCKKLNIEVKKVYQNSVIALQEIDQLSECSFILLDIHMPDISGFDILKNKPHTKVVILSADTTKAIKAFDYDVIDFLEKPIEFERFIRSVNRVKERLKPKKQDTLIKTVIGKQENSIDKHIFVNINKKLIKLKVEDINIVESKGDYVLIKMEASDDLLVHTTLKRIKEKLPQNKFTQVHRSFIINLKKIVDIEESTIVIGRDVIPISKSKRPQFLENLNILN